VFNKLVKEKLDTRDVNIFEKMSYEDARIVFDKMRENWILQNNISMIEEMFKVRNHLLSLWPNDRAGFFEELWFIIKTNLLINY
jgi:hypothetical protein